MTRVPAIIPERKARFTIALFLGALAAAAHDIPNDVTAQLFVKPEGHRLNVLVRVPLKAMRDLNFPETARGELDIARAGPLLADAAVLWISDYLELYEGDVRMPKRPHVAAARVAVEGDGSFASYEDTVAHFLESPKNDVTAPWNQMNLDVRFEYPIRSERSSFSIHPALARLGVRVVTRSSLSAARRRGPRLRIHWRPGSGAP